MKQSALTREEREFRDWLEKILKKEKIREARPVANALVRYQGESLEALLENGLLKSDGQLVLLDRLSRNFDGKDFAARIFRLEQAYREAELSESQVQQLVAKVIPFAFYEEALKAAPEAAPNDRVYALVTYGAGAADWLRTTLAPERIEAIRAAFPDLSESNIRYALLHHTDGTMAWLESLFSEENMKAIQEKFGDISPSRVQQVMLHSPNRFMERLEKIYPPLTGLEDLPERIRAALHERNEDAVAALIRDYGPETEGLEIQLDEKGEYELFSLVKPERERHKKIRLSIPGHENKTLRLKFRKDAQGYLWTFLEDPEAEVVEPVRKPVFEAYYDPGEEKLLTLKEHFKLKILNPDKYPELASALEITRQPSGNYFAFLVNGKTINLKRNQKMRYEGVASDPALATLYVRGVKEKDGYAVYGFLEPEATDPDRAVGKWRYDPEQLDFINAFFVPPGAAPWFYFVVTGAVQNGKSFFRRVELDGQGRALLTRQFYVRVGENYVHRGLSIPEEVLIVNSPAEPQRIDLYEVQETDAESGLFEPEGRNYIASKFYDKKSGLLERDWQEATRRLEKFEKKRAKKAPAGILMTGSTGLEATVEARTHILNDRTGKPVQVTLPEHQGKLLFLRFVTFEHQGATRNGVDLIELDENRNPGNRLRRLYREDEEIIWVDLYSGPQPLTPGERQAIRKELEKLGYRKPVLRPDNQLSTSGESDSPELSPFARKQRREDQKFEQALADVEAQLSAEEEDLIRISDHFAGLQTLRGLSGMQNAAALIYFVLKNIDAIPLYMHDVYLEEMANWLNQHKQVDLLDVVERHLKGNASGLDRLDRLWKVIMRSEARREEMPAVTAAQKKLWEGPRQQILPLRWEAFGLAALALLLENWLGRPVDAGDAEIGLAMQDSILKREFGGQAYATTPAYDEALKRTSEGGTMAVWSTAWLQRFTEDHPRALYLLLTQAQKAADAKALENPLIGFVGDEKVFEQIEHALTRRQGTGPQFLNWEEQLEAREFLLPRLRRIVQVIPPDALADFVASRDYGVGTLLDAAAAIPDKMAGANFLLDPASVADEDLMAVALLFPSLLEAARLTQGISDKGMRLRRLQEVIASAYLFPGSQPHASGFTLAFETYVQAVLINQRLVASSA